jgi:hypothetical protein
LPFSKIPGSYPRMIDVNADCFHAFRVTEIGFFLNLKNSYFKPSTPKTFEALNCQIEIILL